MGFYDIIIKKNIKVKPYLFKEEISREYNRHSYEKGIVTGIMKISQESIFSSFNNPEIATVIDDYCSDSFGFTEKEVKTILE